VKKKNKVKQFVLSVAVIVAVFCFVSSSSTSFADGQTPPSSPVRYTDVGNGFSLVPPSTWIKYNGPSDYLVQYLSPYEQGGNTSCYLGVWTENTTSSLNDCFELRLSQIGQFDHATVIAQGDRSVAGYSSRQVTYEFISQGIDLKVKEYHFLDGERHLEILYVAVPVIFDSYLPSFEQSVSTLQLGNDVGNSNPPSQSFPVLIVVGVVVVAVVAAILGIFLFSRRKKALLLPPPPPS